MVLNFLFFCIYQECERLHYRNSSDTSISTSGSCHMCPCQVHVESCSLDEYGRITYVCSSGYTGHECREREDDTGYPQPPYPQPPYPQPPYPQPSTPEPTYPQYAVITISPNRVDENEGAIIKLTCTPSDPKQRFRYVWYKDNKPIEMGSRVFAYENILYVRNALVSDSGEYRCEATSNDNVYTSSAMVNIRGTSGVG